MLQAFRNVDFAMSCCVGGPWVWVKKTVPPGGSLPAPPHHLARERVRRDLAGPPPLLCALWIHQPCLQVWTFPKITLNCFRLGLAQDEALKQSFEKMCVYLDR